MLQALNPLSDFYWGERIGRLDSATAIRQALDVRAKAKQLPSSPSFWSYVIDGPSFPQAVVRNVLYILATPLRVALTIIIGLAQILRECPHYALKDQSRVVWRISKATLYQVVHDIGSWILPFHDPNTVVRTTNTVSPSAASLYTQADLARIPFVKALPNIVKKAFHLEGISMDDILQGQCFGKSWWMGALFMHLEDRCPDVRARLQLVSRLDKNGACKEAALLQLLQNQGYTDSRLGSLITTPLDALTFSIHTIKYVLLLPIPAAINALKNLLRKETSPTLWARIATWISPKKKSSYLSTILQKVQDRNIAYFRCHSGRAETARLLHLNICGSYCFRRDRKGASSARPFKGQEGIANLPKGFHFVGTQGHAMFYVKESNTQGYLYDPNFGWQSLPGREHWKHLANLSDEYNSPPITFLRMTKRHWAHLGPLELPRRLAEIFSW